MGLVAVGWRAFGVRRSALGEKSRAQAVAAQMIRDGVPANHIYIVADPEAFGTMSLGKEDASVIDRKVTIFFSR